MVIVLSQFWPQIMALSMALGVSLAITGLVGAIKHVSPQSPTIRRWLPALPVMLGAAICSWTWPDILRLAFTGYPELDAVAWEDYGMVCLMLGIAQGAVSASLYKFWTQTIMGRDGALERGLFRFVDRLRPQNLGDDV